MLKFQWNGLRAGHHVDVHDSASPDMTLMHGVVVGVDAHLGRGGSNGVQIRVTDDDGTGRVVRPKYLAVHLDPADDGEACWRCDEIAESAPASRQCGRCRAMFPGDPTLPRGLDTGWWTCPACHDLLMGSGAR